MSYQTNDGGFMPYEPVPRLTVNPYKDENSVVRHLTQDQYQDELAFCAQKVDQMVRMGMDLQSEANAKLFAINKERIRTGYTPLLDFVHDYDMTGVWPVRFFVLADGSRSPLPHVNGMPDLGIFERLIKMKLIMPDPFSEAVKTSRFCEIWKMDEDEYIMRYQRWLGDVDLYTEGGEEESSEEEEDEVNMGGINLSRIERFVDNLPIVPGTSHQEDEQQPEVEETDADSGGLTEETSEVSSDGISDGSNGEPPSPSSSSDAEIDTILQRRVDWGIMSQVQPSDQEEATSNQEEATSEDETTEEPTQEEQDDVDDESEEEEFDESPKKKQKTGEDTDEEDTDEEDTDEADTVQGDDSDGDNNDGDDSDDEEDGDNSEESKLLASGIEILCTGSFSY
ncbi:hypothetical protein SEMRO_152_G069570.1 [Seminavis robusta]|uniref:Uncharacterized protein n=1 Tax=Seminavis robusta TaxID=568900 RepID=A0A9N8H5U6_9STRA|nr:hypothetical protein SEMRO_152_G069570.1 [Seminavis robusta]|eukprot:Sro152_g069570.1 n/a (395) ;mRNA; f:82979-84163